MVQIGRRAVLQAGCLWLGTWPSLSIAQEEPAVRFGLLTDVHHADKPPLRTRYYRESLQKLREAAAEFRSSRVAFAVELGDLVDAAEDVETERNWLKEADREFRACGVPTHYVLGNHCVQTLKKADFLSTVGQSQANFSFDQSGIRFIVLDACYRRDGVSYDAGNFDWKDTDVPPAQREWLTNTLRSATGKAVVFVHQRIDIPGVHSVASAPEIRSILQRSGKVLAVFQGHSHQNDYRELEGIHYCTMRAVIEGSGEESSGYSVISMFSEGRVLVKGFRAQQPYNLT